MRCIILVIPAVYASAEPRQAPSEERIAEMGVYNRSLMDAGILEMATGLQPPTAGATVVFDDDGTDVLGVEPAGSVGGFWIVNVESLEEAVDWARRCPMEPGDMLEVRPMESYDDES